MEKYGLSAESQIERTHTPPLDGFFIDKPIDLKLSVKQLESSFK